MKTWKFVAMSMSKSAGRPAQFSWRWREEVDGKAARHSQNDFDLYFECLQDARAHGYAGPNPRPQRYGAIGESAEVNGAGRRRA